MLTRRAIAFRVAAALAVAAVLPACRPVSISFKLYTPTPSPTPPIIRVYSQYSEGDTLELVQIQLGLDNYEVRYRSTMPEGQMGIVYFLEDGNLHIDAKKIGDTWVILAAPFLEPSTVPAADRVAEWDRGADKQQIRSNSQR